MRTKYTCLLLIGVLCLQGCGILIIFSEDKRALREYQLHEEEYKPYKLQNTVEGYKEFIAKYPKNLFINEAKSRIESLEFSPYEQADTIEGFMEFKMRYPENRHVFKANVRIEQVELKRYEKADTIEGYKEFLSKYPESTFAVLAKERLQELEFRRLDGILIKQYGFDLLLYRLHLKRVKKKLGAVGGVNLGGFTCFASIASHEGKKYFHTRLIYSSDLSYLDASSSEVSERFFNPVISKALPYLHNHFKPRGEIDGFSFDVSSSPHSFYGDSKPLLEYYFPLNQVNLFTQHKLDNKEMLSRAAIVIPKKPLGKSELATAKKIPGTGEEPATKEVAGIAGQALHEEKSLKEKVTTPLVIKDAFKIMTMVSERDRGKDFIISRSWKRGRHSMQTLEKRKNLGSKDGLINKSVIKYLSPPSHYGESFLIWNYKDRVSALWHRPFRGNAQRITSVDRYTPPAETDFYLKDYLEIKVGEEKHTLLKNEQCGEKTCYVVESTPLKKNIKYGKRITWVDQRYFMPLKIDYFDKTDALWKTLTIKWQNKFGFWFWRKATVENVQNDSKTLISVDDVRVNLGLHDRDFTKQGLEQKKHGF
jgi:hypothetical protein